MPQVCPVCSSAMRPADRPWMSACPACELYRGDLRTRINEDGGVLSEPDRAQGLRALREANDEVLLSRLHGLGLRPGASLLDVGCAWGWFVQAAADRGLRAEGIEPDQGIAEVARRNGAAVRVGLFPEVLEVGERFDCITFNDVLEHLPHPRAVLEEVRDRLAPGGLLSIAIPNSRGLIYRAGTAAARVGRPAVLDRLWQVDTPSPHLWYFDEANLTRLGTDVGLTLVSAGVLDAVAREGMLARVRSQGQPGPTAVLTAAAAAVAAPLLNSPRFSDSMHLVFRV